VATLVTKPYPSFNRNFAAFSRSIFHVKYLYPATTPCSVKRSISSADSPKSANTAAVSSPGTLGAVIAAAWVRENLGAGDCCNIPATV
jgi:hypothetical protein